MSDEKRKGPGGTYQGHKNWNHWNVALWLFNDQGTYEVVKYWVEANPGNRDEAARIILSYMDYCSPETPDGAPYTFTSVRAALVGWES